MAANVLFGQLGRRRADRVFRERFSIGDMNEEEIRRRYRFGKESIKQIVDLLDPIIGPKTKRSQSLSTELQVQNKTKNLLLQRLRHAILTRKHNIGVISPFLFMRHISRHHTVADPGSAILGNMLQSCVNALKHLNSSGSKIGFLRGVPLLFLRFCWFLLSKLINFTLFCPPPPTPSGSANV